MVENMARKGRKNAGNSPDSALFSSTGFQQAGLVSWNGSVAHLSVHPSFSLCLV